MFGFLKLFTPAAWWCVGILGGLVVLEAGALWLAIDSRDEQLTKAAQASVAADTCADLNVGEQQTNDDLRERLAACVGEPEDTVAIADAVDKALGARLGDIEAAARRGAASREKLYGIDACRALRDLPVCAELDARLRKPADADRGADPDR